MSLAVPLSLVAVLAAVLVALVVALRRTAARSAAVEARCESALARAGAARRALADLEVLPVLDPLPERGLPVSGVVEATRPERVRAPETPDRGASTDGRRTARRPPAPPAAQACLRRPPAGPPMKLNLLDIRRQQFAKKTFGGYDVDEVDGFVKQITEQWEEMLDEGRASADRAVELENKLRHYERVERALQEALETARESGRRAETMAEQKAKMIVEEAELRARQILQDAERERHGARQDVVRLTSRQTEIGARLRGFLLSELEILAQYQGDDPVGFIKLQPASAPGALEAPREASRLGVHEERLEAGDPLGDDAGEVWAGDRRPDAPGADDVRASYQDRPVPAAPPPVSEPHAAASPPETPSAPEAPSTPRPEPTVDAVPEALERPPAAPSADAPPPAPDAAAPSEAPTWAPDLPDAPAPAWNLRSLVTGEGDSVAGSEAERDRIRRILDDLD